MRRILAVPRRSEKATAAPELQAVLARCDVHRERSLPVGHDVEYLKIKLEEIAILLQPFAALLTKRRKIRPEGKALLTPRIL